MICFRAPQCLKWVFWSNFQRDVCLFLVRCRTLRPELALTTASEPTSTLLHVSSPLSVRSRICQTSRLMRSQPSLHSMKSLRSSLSVLCGTALCLSLVCFRVASIRPISASRRFALQRLCVTAGTVLVRSMVVMVWRSSRSSVAELGTAGRR